jgi:hypothetical protein
MARQLATGSLSAKETLVFPSFIMHLALSVQRGTRWPLVSWLTRRWPMQ